MKDRTPMKFETIPSWTYDADDHSVHSFFAAITLSNLDHKHIRITAEDQRKLLGFPIFGKKEIKVFDGVVKCYHMKAFGQDCDITEHTPSDLKRFIESKTKITC